MKLRELLFLVLCTTLCGACSHGEMQRRLAEVDSLTDAHYDSALVLLAGMDSLPMRHADRMYLELLRGKAMNKASVPFTTDSVMRRVAAYYDHHGSRNCRLLAHYVLGCAYRDLGSAPRALEEYQRAVSLADTTRADCDLSTLMRVHGQMSNLYMLMRMTEETLREDSIAQQLCYCMRDSLMALLYEEDLCIILYREGKYEECIKEAQRIYNQYMDSGKKDNAALVCIHIVRSYLGLGEYEKAKHYLDIYEQSAYIQGDHRKIAGGLAPFFLNKANCYLGLGMADSAEIFFRKAKADMHLMHNEAAVYDGLSRMFILKQIPDSVYNYSRMSIDALTRKFDVAEVEAAARVKSIYDYNVEQKIARERSQRAQRLAYLLVLAIIIIVMTFVGALWLNEKKRRRISELRIKIAEATDKLRLAEEGLAAATEGQNGDQEKLRESETAIKEQEQIIARLTNELDKITTSTTNKNLSNEPIVINIQKVLEAPTRPQVQAIQWQELKVRVEELFPTFYQRMNGLETLSVLEYRVCLLVKAGFSPSQIEALLDMKPRYASIVRKRLYKKVFGTEGSSTDFDRKVRDFG